MVVNVDLGARYLPKMVLVSISVRHFVTIEYRAEFRSQSLEVGTYRTFAEFRSQSSVFEYCAEFRSQS